MFRNDYRTDNFVNRQDVDDFLKDLVAVFNKHGMAIQPFYDRGYMYVVPMTPEIEEQCLHMDIDGV